MSVLRYQFLSSFATRVRVKFYWINIIGKSLMSG